MYRLCSNASRVSHRTWMGARTRRVCEHPSGRHRCAVPEAAVEGTRAQDVSGHRECRNKFLPDPLVERAMSRTWVSPDGTPHDVADEVLYWPPLPPLPPPWPLPMASTPLLPLPDPLRLPPCTRRLATLHAPCSHVLCRVRVLLWQMVGRSNGALSAHMHRTSSTF